MTRLDDTGDPRAPYNEPEHAWYELFNEENPPTCHGCNLDHRPVEYYEPVLKGRKYFFYCRKCVVEAKETSQWKRWDLFLEANNLFSIF